MALFVSLVMLLILTVLGISSVQSTSMQERMARNAMDANLAFQAAESAIRDAEVFMEGLSDLDDFPLDSANAAAAAANGYYVQVDPDQSEVWETVDWTGALVRTAESSVPGVVTQPKYVVEFLKTVVSDQDRLNLDNIGQDTGSGRTQMFRVTAYGTGGTVSAHVTLQSNYGKRF